MSFRREARRNGSGMGHLHRVRLPASANHVSTSALERRSHRHDIRRNGRLRRGTVALVVRLMGRAFLLRPLSQPADYDATRSERERERAGYLIPRAPATVTPFARLMTRGRSQLPAGPFFHTALSQPKWDINSRLNESTVSRIVPCVSPPPHRA